MGTGPAVDVGFKPYVPTRKWVAALVAGVSAVVVHAILSGGWDETENGELGALAVSLAGAYIRRNDPTPGGIRPE